MQPLSCAHQPASATQTTQAKQLRKIPRRSSARDAKHAAASTARRHPTQQLEPASGVCATSAQLPGQTGLSHPQKALQQGKKAKQQAPLARAGHLSAAQRVARQRLTAALQKARKQQRPPPGALAHRRAESGEFRYHEAVQWLQDCALTDELAIRGVQLWLHSS